jgi:hypothetical protein
VQISNERKLRWCAHGLLVQRQSLWSLDLYSECNTGHGNSQINDDPKLGQHGMQDCAFEIDNGVYDLLVWFGVGV